MSELRGLGAIDQSLRQAGGRLLAVSVDTPDQSLLVVEKNGLSYPILSDTDREAVRQFGVLHRGGGPNKEDIAIPSQFLINTNGEIVWRRVAGKIQDRPDPSHVIATLKKLLAAKS